MHLPGKILRKNTEAGKKHPIRTLFDTYEERHAFIIGFGEIFPPWPPTYKMPRSVQKNIRPEYHYYRAGRTIGFLALLGVALLLKKLLWR